MPSLVSQPPSNSQASSQGGIGSYYQTKTEYLQLAVNRKTQNLRRLEAQRNSLNARVRLLREELQLLQEPGSYVGEVVKVMGKKKVLVKVQPEGKYVVDFAPSIQLSQLTPALRVALRSDSYQLHSILPSKVDPLVSLMMVEKVPDSTYEMVGGLDKQIKEIKEVIELPVKHPELFDALGIAQPKGVLLYGPPGTGKTLLARAVAHHTDCRFIRVSGSELVQKYIGEGSRMVRELFVMAREHAPSIIFMDEIDSIGSSRGESGSGGGDSEVQRTMLELLNQLDGFEPSKNIKVIMATNRIDILDSALLRPGRVDRKIEFPPPGPEARVAILRIHSRKMSLTRGINLRALAEKMGNCSGAEVKGICTEAGMYALRERRQHVTQEDLELAVAKVLKRNLDASTSTNKLFMSFLPTTKLLTMTSLFLRPTVWMVRRSRTTTTTTFHHSISSLTPTIKPTTGTPRRRTVFLGTLVALAGLGWSIDRYLYAEALARTLRLAYNAGLTILDYKLNFNPDSSPDQLHERVSRRISTVCDRNGGLYIKLGQSIAIQAAILPPAYKKAFETMFDAAKPLPFHQILRVWNQEFPDQSLDQHFDQFDQTPIACGSIAQVHRARLKGSSKLVAVKIQRPDIPIQIELDLFAYRSLLYVYQKVFELPVYFIAHYVSDQIRKETDFLCEARNSERTARFLQADPSLRDHIYVPKVHWPLTTSRILTTEYVEDGCRLTDQVRLDEKRLKKKEVMDLAMRMFTQMLFSYGWLHCDLHPGNVLVYRHHGKPKLALIDHGLYIQLPDKFRRDYCELWRSLFVLDTESIDRIARGWGIANSDLFASATLLRPFKTRKPTYQPGADRQLTKGTSNLAYESSLKIKETMKTLLENEALIPQELIFIVRCMRMMQGNNQVLGSPTNRINILAHGAAAGMAINPPKPSSLLSDQVDLRTVVRRWMEDIVKLWKFRTVLVLVDLGFLFTRVRQWWLTQVIGGPINNSLKPKNREGFEDLLQRQLENLAKEEFGVTLDDSAFMG